MMYSGTPLRGHPSFLHLLNPKYNPNKPLTRGHPLYNGQFFLVPMVSALERVHCIYTLTELHPTKSNYNVQLKEYD